MDKKVRRRQYIEKGNDNILWIKSNTYMGIVLSLDTSKSSVKDGVWQTLYSMFHQILENLRSN